MSSTILEPGAFLIAQRSMRSWEDVDTKGTSGTVISVGQQALLIATWLVGEQRRFRVIRDERILLFSCPDHVTFRNWKVA